MCDVSSQTCRKRHPCTTTSLCWTNSSTSECWKSSKSEGRVFLCTCRFATLCSATRACWPQGETPCGCSWTPKRQSSRRLVSRLSTLSNRLLFSPRSIIGPLNVPTTEWQVGKTKLFLRRCVHEPLEEKRTQIVQLQAVIIQRSWKRYAAMKEFLRTREAAMKIQHGYRGWKQRILFLRQRRAAIVIQSHLRGVFAREVRDHTILGVNLIKNLEGIFSFKKSRFN